MAQGFDRRDVIPDRISSTVQSEQGRVPLAPIMTPRPASQKSAGSEYSELSNLLGAASGVLDKYVEKKTNEAIIEGELAFAEGVTEDEIRAKGNKHTTAGFMSMQLRTAGNEWMQNELAAIEGEDHAMSPSEYRQKLSNGFKELSNSVGDDPMLNDMLAGMARDIMPKLMSKQTAAHNDWNKSNTIDSYTDLLVSETGTDPETLLELADPNNSPLGIDDHRGVLSRAVSIQLDSGVSTLYDALTPNDATVQDFMKRGFKEEEATDMFNAFKRYEHKKSSEFTAKRASLERTILDGVNGNEPKSIQEIMTAKEENNFTDAWANTMLSKVRTANAAYEKEQQKIRKVGTAVLNNEGYLLTGEDRKTAITTIAEIAATEAEAASVKIPENQRMDFQTKEARRIYHTKLLENGIIDDVTVKKDIANAAVPETLMDKEGNVSDNAMNAIEDLAIIRQVGGPALMNQYLEEGTYMSDLAMQVFEMSESSNMGLEDAIQVTAARMSTSTRDEPLSVFSGDYAKRDKAIRKAVDEAMRPSTLLGRIVSGNVYTGSTKEEREMAMQDARLINEVNRQFGMAVSDLQGSGYDKETKEKIALNRAVQNTMSRTEFIDGQAIVRPVGTPTVAELAGVNGDTTAVTRGVKGLFKDIAPKVYAGRGYDLTDGILFKEPKMDIQYHAESGNLIIRPYDDMPTGVIDTVLPFLRPDDIIDDPIVMNIRDVGDYIRGKDLGDDERVQRVLDKYTPTPAPSKGDNPYGVLSADELLSGGSGKTDTKGGQGSDDLGEPIAYKDVPKHTLYGSKAVEAIEAREGALTPEMVRVIELEGYVPKPYWDAEDESKRTLTVGVGQTGKWMDKSFKESFKHHEDQTRKLVKGYDDLPQELRAELVQATYRGDLGGSPKAVKLINEGNYREAAKEFLNNQDYRDELAKESRTGRKSGIAKRMQDVAYQLFLQSKR